MLLTRSLMSLDRTLWAISTWRCVLEGKAGISLSTAASSSRSSRPTWRRYRCHVCYKIWLLVHLFDKIQILVCLMSLNTLTEGHDSSDNCCGAVVDTVVVTIKRSGGCRLHLLNKYRIKSSSSMSIFLPWQQTACPRILRTEEWRTDPCPKLVEAQVSGAGSPGGHTGGRRRSQSARNQTNGW